jgi:hypothetical protein
MSDIGGVAAPGRMYGLAFLEQKRNEWISRFEKLEEQWQEFMKSPRSKDSDTLMRTAELYNGKKDHFIKMLAENREQHRVEQQFEDQRRADEEQRIADEMRTAAMADYYHTSFKQPDTTSPNFYTIYFALFERLKKYPEQRIGKNVYETLHDLFRFMIYYIKMEDYDPAMKDEIVAVRRVLNDDPVVLDHLPHIAKALRDHVNDHIHKLSPDNWAEVDQISKKYFDKTSRGGHKSARRGKSKSKSRSKCRSRSRSKSRHRHRG